MIFTLMQVNVCNLEKETLKRMKRIKKKGSETTVLSPETQGSSEMWSHTINILSKLFRCDVSKHLTFLSIRIEMANDFSSEYVI